MKANLFCLSPTVAKSLAHLRHIIIYTKCSKCWGLLALNDVII